MITVRLAEKSDAGFIAEAEKAYIDCPWTEEQILSEIQSENAVFFTAEVDGKICGYVSGDIAADECEMSNIAVDTEYRNRGVAYALMTEFISALAGRNIKSVFLLVRDDNGAAIGLYNKCGFKTVGKRTGYYKGKDALIMQLTL